MLLWFLIAVVVLVAGAAIWFGRGARTPWGGAQQPGKGAKRHRSSRHH